jgi:hypothetical protein
MKILFKVTSRSRPIKLLETLDNIISKCSTDNYDIVLSLDQDDNTCNTLEFKNILSDKYPKVKVYYGLSKSKVDAINRDMDKTSEWDILVNVSDDQRFLVFGFDEMIRKGFKDHFPNLDGFIHYPDENAREALATMSIMGKPYYDRFNYIYHPEYISLWCDNEAMQVAKILNKYVFINILIFDHFHPAYKKAERDDQYKYTESFYHSDKEIYLKRKNINFEL